jgi:hypothetical protein
MFVNHPIFERNWHLVVPFTKYVPLSLGTLTVPHNYMLYSQSIYICREENERYLSCPFLQ